MLGAIYNAARADGLVMRNPVEGTRLPRTPSTRIEVPQPEEINRIADERPAPSDLAMLFLAYTGVRWGEMAALQVRDLDLDAGRAHIRRSLSEVRGHLHWGVPKTHRNRVIGVPTFLIDRLREITKNRSADELVFTTGLGAPQRSTNSRTQVWLPALKRAGLDRALRTHDLRHFCASVLIRSGAPPTLVARQLGHSSPRVTLDIYSHLFPDELSMISDRLEAVYDTARRER